MMDAVFLDMIDDNLVIIYMVDILIFAPDELILAVLKERSSLYLILS